MAGEDAGRLAGQLLERFGSLARIFASSEAELDKAAPGLPGVSGFIVSARNIVDTARKDELSGQQLRTDDPQLLSYLRGIFSACTTELLHVIFCDTRRNYLRDETVAEGGRNGVTLRASPLLRRALALGAGGMLLAHNHPSGDCRPSKDDIKATRELRSLAEALDIDLIDHLIFAPGRAYSMRAGGHF